MATRIKTKKEKQKLYDKSLFDERQENILRLRTKLNKPDNRVRPFTKYKILTYILNIVCPPWALYRIWNKNSDFNQSEKFIQSMVVSIYVSSLVLLLTGHSLA